MPVLKCAMELSIIVVAYNNSDLLRAMLISLVQQIHGITYEIIVVDNASPDRSIEGVVRDFPQVRLLQSKYNLGFAAANNQGIRASQGRYIALLNPDTLLHDDELGVLMRWLDSHPDVGAAGPQLLQLNGQPQAYSYGRALTPWYLLRRIWSHVRGTFLHEWQGTKPQDVDWVAGTCLVVRRQALQAVGGLDERFFLYFEDADLGMRLRQAGWRVVFVPTVAVTHVGGGSVGAQARGFYDRSLVRLYRKHYGRVAACIIWLALRLYRGMQEVSRRLRTTVGRSA
jgi:N-acetylglucosaminyl-diphospho-decaprenol L-rhamnosyltransferase